MHNYKLRLKDPSGAEFEAEGPADFVQSEKASFLQTIRLQTASSEAPGPQAGAQAGSQESGFWDKLATVKDGSISLRFKSPDITAAEAALILLAANRALNQSEDLGALALAKALRSSGYQPERLDRVLTKEIKTGRAAASGTKRNRTYRITKKGLETIFGAIKTLTKNTGQ